MLKRSLAAIVSFPMLLGSCSSANRQDLFIPEPGIHQPSLTRASSSQPRIELCSGVYGDRINYADFSKIDWSRICNSSRIPVDLEAVLEQGIVQKIVDRQEFETRISGMIYSRKNQTELASLTPKEAIALAVDISESSMEYADVDNGEEFAEIRAVHCLNNSLMPLDICLKIGKGDCDKFASLTSELFKFIKQNNPFLEGVYVLPTKFCSEDIYPLSKNHTWNTIILLEEDRIAVSQIDPTFHKNSGDLEATLMHINPSHVAANFYYELASFSFNKLLERKEQGVTFSVFAHNTNLRIASELYKKLLDSEERGEYRAKFYARIGYAGFINECYDEILEAETGFLSEGLGKICPEDQISVLFYAARTAYSIDQNKEALKKRLELAESFNPDAFYTNLIRKLYGGE